MCDQVFKLNLILYVYYLDCISKQQHNFAYVLPNLVSLWGYFRLYICTSNSHVFIALLRLRNSPAFSYWHIINNLPIDHHLSLFVLKQIFVYLGSHHIPNNTFFQDFSTHYVYDFSFRFGVLFIMISQHIRFLWF